MMPNPWKRSKISSFSRFVAGLRSKRAADSPLVVQTGFPTSLADLVVKNRSRLRKHSSKKKPTTRHVTPPGSLDSFGSRVSEIITVVEAAEEQTTEDAATADIVDEEPCGGAPSGEIAARSDLAARSSEVPIAITPSRGVGGQAKVVLVMTLAVCTKELVLGVMLSAFVLLFLESVGSRVLAWMRHTEEGQRRVEVEVADSESVRLEKRRRPSSGFEQQTAVSPERSDLGRVESGKLDEGTAKVKRKHWRKVIAEKFRGSKRGKDTKELMFDRCSGCGDSGSSVDRSGEEAEEAMGELNDEGEAEEEDGNIGVYEEDKQCKSNGGSSHVFLFVIVLSGLVGGKVVALVLTVACCYLMKMAGFVGSSQKIQGSSCAIA